MATSRDGVSRGVNDESAKIFSDLRSRDEDVRSRAARELRDHVRPRCAELADKRLGAQKGEAYRSPDYRHFRSLLCLGKFPAILSRDS